MNYKKIRINKRHKTFKESIKTSLRRICKHEFSDGVIYTCYRKYDKKILIGYINSMRVLKELEMENGYSIIDKRWGSSNEPLILKKVLKEMGFNYQSIDGSYNYSESLLKHLSTLGWPIGNLYKLNKIKKSL